MVSTLSLWSWSTIEKLRIVGQGFPSLAVAIAGTFNVPLIAALLASLKNAEALQNDTWVKMLPGRPFTQRAFDRLLVSDEASVRLAPLKPIQSATVAFAGKVGSTGATAGLVP